MARNQYPGKCVRCGAHVAAQKGHFEKVSRDPAAKLHRGRTTRWVIRCLVCVGKGHTKEDTP